MMMSRTWWLGEWLYRSRQGKDCGALLESLSDNSGTIRTLIGIDPFSVRKETDADFTCCSCLSVSPNADECMTSVSVGASWSVLASSSVMNVLCAPWSNTIFALINDDKDWTSVTAVLRRTCPVAFASLTYYVSVCGVILSLCVHRFLVTPLHWIPSGSKYLCDDSGHRICI